MKKYTVSSGTTKNDTSQPPSLALYFDGWAGYFGHSTQLKSFKTKWIQRLLNPTNAS